MTKSQISQFDLFEVISRLVEVSVNADFTEVRRIGNALSRYLEENGHTDEAKRIRTALRKKSSPLRASGHVESLPVDGKSRIPLVEEQPWPDTPIFLPERANEVFNRFVEEVKNSDRLSREGLTLRPCLLLSGPPGTGKTLFAAHIASRIDRPLYVVRLDSVISSFLGETAKNIRSVFEFFSRKEAVLLLDEMDAIAKMRDDRHELGELKRVVNTLIQGLDSLDEFSIIIGATNHPQLLDPAIWRRFPYKVELGLPEQKLRSVMWDHFLFSDKGDPSSLKVLGLASEGLTGADIREIAMAERRRAALQEDQVNLGTIIWSLAEPHSEKSVLPPIHRLSSEQKRAVSKFLHGSLSIKQTDIARILNTSRQAISSYIKGDEDESEGKL